MRKFPSEFLLKTVLLFSVIVFIFNSFNINIFLLPAVSLFFTVAVCEKSAVRRFIVLVSAFFIFIQLSYPLPLIFIISLSVQLYIASLAIFEITTFEIPVLAFFSVFVGHIISNLNLFAFVYFTSKTTDFITLIINVAVGTLIQILFFAFFKAEISSMFVKDRWI